jgi:hypothetical protein
MIGAIRLKPSLDCVPDGPELAKAQDATDDNHGLSSRTFMFFVTVEVKTTGRGVPARTTDKACIQRRQNHAA